MFDVGFAELLLLAMVGLMVLGPERLPGVARTLGGLTRKARSSWLNLKRSIEAEMRAEELKKPLKQFQDEVEKARSKVNTEVEAFRNSYSPPTPPPTPPPPAASPATAPPAGTSAEPAEPGPGVTGTPGRDG